MGPATRTAYSVFADGRFASPSPVAVRYSAATSELTGVDRALLLVFASYFLFKPIFVFDEWAADQDPIYRKYFYEEMLQKIKERGKTVIAVSHDDRYFGFADRVVKMEYGTFVDP